MSTFIGRLEAMVSRWTYAGLRGREFRKRERQPYTDAQVTTARLKACPHTRRVLRQVINNRKACTAAIRESSGIFYNAVVRISRESRLLPSRIRRHARSFPRADHRDAERQRQQHTIG